MIPSAAVGPNGMFVNAHEAGATTMPLPKPGKYTTDAWVRAGINNSGALEGYELHVPVDIEVVALDAARQNAYGALAGKDKEDDFQKFHDEMDRQMVLLKPGGPDSQGKGHEDRRRLVSLVATPVRRGSDKHEQSDPPHGRDDIAGAFIVALGALPLLPNELRVQVGIAAQSLERLRIARLHRDARALITTPRRDAAGFGSYLGAALAQLGLDALEALVQRGGAAVEGSAVSGTERRRLHDVHALLGTTEPA
jgi:hypothetical protein